MTTLNENGTVQYKHPYEAEILGMSYPESLYQTAEPIPYQPVETTSATWVDTYEGVLEMLQELKSAKEIAVDLEHHDYRTYVGLVSLMQVSTREKDWIVDTLQPWRHKLEVLNEVFTDPSIVKVSCVICPSSHFSNGAGLPWSIYGHGMAAARLGPLCEWTFRHVLCL